MSSFESSINKAIEITIVIKSFSTSPNLLVEVVR